MWDFFEPIACDVHCATFSAVRDMFMKLLRPGVDYVRAFEAYVERRLKQKMAEAESKDQSFGIDAQNRLRSEMSLSKSDMRKFLRSLGFDIKLTELRVLIDAFDANGDGTVTVSEFKDFVGPKRDKKGGVSAIIGQKCCWQTTCRRTGNPNVTPELSQLNPNLNPGTVTIYPEGMANAYSVSAGLPKKGSNVPSRSEAKGSRQDDGADYDEKEEEDEVAELGTGKTIVTVLKNGKSRVQFSQFFVLMMIFRFL